MGNLSKKSKEKIICELYSYSRYSSVFLRKKSLFVKEVIDNLLNLDENSVNNFTII